MTPNLPRPFLWTNIKTTKEFLEGDTICSLLFDVYSYLYRTCISPQKNNVVFLNEFYYQLTRVYYENPSSDEFEAFNKEITKDIGREPRAALLMIMIYHYIKLRDGEWTTTRNGLLSTIKEKFSSTPFWAKFEMINIPPRLYNPLKIDPKKPSPVSPWELMEKNIDWKELTLFYHVGTIKEIIMLWKNKDDKSMVAAMIEKSMNKMQMIYPHHELDFQIVRDYFRSEKLLDDSAALDPYAENQKLKAKLERLEKKNKELRQQHEEDDARMLSGFGAPIIMINNGGEKEINQQIYDTDKNHRISESKRKNESVINFIETKSIEKNKYLNTQGKVIFNEVNPSPPHDKAPKDIPTKCVKAVTKVITDSITVDGTVYISQTQLRKAVKLIDLDKNTEIGILLVICREVGIVKPSASNVDFVRALTGMSILKYEDDKKIERIAHGFSVKIKNLDPKHTLWSGSDRSLGDKLYEELRKV